MNNLILVRHGQSKWNLEKRFTGWADIDLTEKGRSEAQYAGKLIGKLDINFDSYFTSQLKRAQNSLKIILKILNKKNPTIYKAWQLNERHYGGLTSLNKDETIKKYGKDQVKKWRRSFDVPPPTMDTNHPYRNKIIENAIKKKITTKMFNFDSESLKDTFDRVIPYYNKNIEPLISAKKNILIVFHGNSCRALLMKIFNISRYHIDQFEIPTGNPLLIRFASDLKIKDYRYLDVKRSKKIILKI
tara:strand:- start:58 stop:789 length:732 start_codon:yes stop_codon:yes gene_type:complete